MPSHLPLSPARRIVLALPILVTLVLTGLIVWFGPFPERANTHFYADTRALFGIPRFGDVVSCAGFLVVGVAGLFFLPPASAQGTSAIRNSYIVFLVSLALTSLGAGYYHADPTDARLLYSRLPNVLMIVGLMAAVRAETRPEANGNGFLALVVCAAVGGFVWYYLTKANGAADQGPIILIQLLALLLIPIWQAIHKAPLADKLAIYASLAMFVGSQLVGGRDAAILEATGWISGHTIFHLFGIAAALPIVWALRRRTRMAATSDAPVLLRAAA